MCEICAKSFSRVTSLQNHLKRHYGQFNAECYICKHKEMAVSDLQEHMRRHVSRWSWTLFYWKFTWIKSILKKFIDFFFLNRRAKNRMPVRNVEKGSHLLLIETFIIGFTLDQQKNHTSVRCAQMHLPDPDYYRNTM